MGYSIDPVGQGHVTSLAHPGGNTTGLSSALHEIVSKQVDLLVKMVPNLTRLAVLYNPAASGHELSLKTIEAAARESASSCGQPRRRARRGSRPHSRRLPQSTSML